jgi:polyhydroxyalkanoate synthesis regulator phasin
VQEIFQVQDLVAVAVDSGRISTQQAVAVAELMEQESQEAQE